MTIYVTLEGDGLLIEDGIAEVTYDRRSESIILEGVKVSGVTVNRAWLLEAFGPSAIYDAEAKIQLDYVLDDMDDGDFAFDNERG